MQPPRSQKWNGHPARFSGPTEAPKCHVFCRCPAPQIGFVFGFLIRNFPRRLEQTWVRFVVYPPSKPSPPSPRQADRRTLTAQYVKEPNNHPVIPRTPQPACRFSTVSHQSGHCRRNTEIAEVARRIYRLCIGPPLWQNSGRGLWNSQPRPQEETYECS